MVTQHGFSPFAENGGTTLAISGKDYCIVAGDTRQSQGYEINSRYQPHTFKLSDTVVFSGCGMYADTLELSKQIQARMKLYVDNHGKEMSIGAVAQMLQTILYRKRFFPYYVFTLLGGIDGDGVGAVYSFDPVGSYERESCRANGSAASLIQPFLDNQVKKKNLVHKGDLDIPMEEALKLAKDSFTSATEREIHTGDYLEIFIITKSGVKVEKFDLKKD